MSSNPASLQPQTMSRDDYEAGDLIGGKYRLSRKVGAGAMGTVWIAVNIVLDSKVAIKLLNPELRSPVLVERFLREARAAAILDHPAIVRVFDLGATDRGDPFMVMELIAGTHLGAHLAQQGGVSPERAVQLLLPIAEGIHVAHEHGIVHRDLKPENIMLAECYGGLLQPKVVDFGIAKLKWGEQASTDTGAMVIGTPDYMSPEQASGCGTIDHRSDVWSFAVMLYEALAGRPPFQGAAVWKTMQAVVEEPAPPLDQTIDPRLWAIVERGLEKDPDARWPTMRAFGDALSAWLLARGVSEDVSGVSVRAHWHASPAASLWVDVAGHAGTPTLPRVRPNVVIPLVHAKRFRRRYAAAAALGAAALLATLGAAVAAATHGKPNGATGVSPRPTASAVDNGVAQAALAEPSPAPVIGAREEATPPELGAVLLGDDPLGRGSRRTAPPLARVVGRYDVAMKDPHSDGAGYEGPAARGVEGGLDAGVDASPAPRRPRAVRVSYRPDQP